MVVFRPAFLSAGLVLSLHPGIATAGPEGGQVVGGQGAISRPDANTTVINQQSQNLAVDWTSFNVKQQELVQFNQPSSSANAINRIYDQNPSQIHGSIRANGNVTLLNPNGVFFSPTASVNVNNLKASTLVPDPTRNYGENFNLDFFNGAQTYKNVDGSEGIVVNQGLLEAATGGSVTLAGKAVRNEGVILARAGQVNLVAGEQVTMDFDGDGLMQFTIDKEVLQNAQALNDQVSNIGSIEANGGSVFLAGSAAAEVFTNVVNNEGMITAGRIENKGGIVRLVGMGSGASVINTGTINAFADDATSNGGSITLESTATTTVSADSRIDATAKGAVGGTVQILGDEVALLDNSSISVSGEIGGGEVLVGGDFQGKNPEIKNATFTTVEDKVTIKADAITNGDGGKVIVWADDTTRYSGHISARGGAKGGDGGFVEVSGKRLLDIPSLLGRFDISSPVGTGGTLLLDPNRINIVSGPGGAVSNPVIAGGGVTLNLNDDDVSAFLNGGGLFAVTLNLITTDTSSQDDDITFEAGTIVTVGPGATLNATAGDEVLVNGTVNVFPGAFGLAAGSFNPVNGDVDIEITVNQSYNKTYDNNPATDPAFDNYTTSGTFEGTFNNAALGRTNTSQNVATYAIDDTSALAVSGGTGRAHEFFIVNSEVFQITPAPGPTVTTLNQSRNYGAGFTLDNTVGNGFNISGLVGGDTVATATLASPGETAAAANVGTTFPITASGVAGGTFVPSNYGPVNFVNSGILTVVQAPLATWTGGGGNTIWSNPLNWDIGAIPSLTNVLDVNLSNANTTFDITSTTLNSITGAASNLTLASGSLTTSAGLTTNGYTQTSGTFTAPSLSVSQLYNLSGGTLNVPTINFTGAGTVNVAGDVITDTINLSSGGTTLNINGPTTIQSSSNNAAINFGDTSFTGNSILTLLTTAQGDNVSLGGGTSSATNLAIPNAFGSFGGSLFIGADVSPPTLPLDTVVISNVADTVTVTPAGFTTNGSLSIFASDILLNGNVSVSSALNMIAVGQADSCAGGPCTGLTGSGLIDVNATPVTLTAGSGLFIAEDQITNPGQLVLNFGGGTVQLAVTNNTDDLSQIQANATSINATTQTTNLISALNLGASAVTVFFLNPAQSLLGLEEVGFVDTGLFEEDLVLFGIIGNGIALSLAQCEEIEGCAPSVTQEELDGLITQLRGKVDELTRRCEAGDVQACGLMERFKEELGKFEAYSEQLQEYSAVDEDELGEDEFEETVPGTAESITRLTKTLETIMARIEFFESLKTNPEEAARLSEITGIELTPEALDDLIEGAKAEAQFIEHEIKLLQDGTEAQAVPILTTAVN